MNLLSLILIVLYIRDLVSECADDATYNCAYYETCCYRSVCLMYYDWTSWWRGNRVWSWIVTNYLNNSAVLTMTVIHSAYIIMMSVIVMVVYYYLATGILIVTWLVVILSETSCCEHCHHSDDHHALEIHCLHCTFVLYC